ncbi:MAG: hypothetical protein MJZ38_00575 [archaeon]|nr:hypothetical protein [archaeon]
MNTCIRGRSAALLAIVIAAVCVLSVPLAQQDSSVADPLSSDLPLFGVTPRDPSLGAPSGPTYGDTALTDDVVLPDGSVVVVLDGSTIDIGDHLLDLGSGSAVYFLGDATVTMVDGGRIVQGEDTTIETLHFSFPTANVSWTFTYDGAMVISDDGVLDYDVSVRHVPGASETLSVSSHDGTHVVELVGFGIERSMDVLAHDAAVSSDLSSYLQALPSNATDVLTLDLKEFRFVERSVDPYDIDTVTSTEVFAVYGDGQHAFRMTVSGLHVSVDEFNFDVFAREMDKPATGVCVRTEVAGIGAPQLSLDSEGILSLTSDISEVRSLVLNDRVSQLVIASGIDLEADFDLVAFLELLFGGSTDISEYLDVFVHAEIDVDSVEIDNDDGDLVLSDLFLAYDLDDTLGILLSVGADVPGIGRIEATAGDISIGRFDIADDRILNLSVGVGHTDITVDDGLAPVEISVEDLVLDVTNLDLYDLSRAETRHGTIDLQDIVDSCDSVEIDAGVIESCESRAEGVYLLQCQVRGLNVFDIGLHRAEVDLGELLGAELLDTAIEIDTDSSLQVVLDALFKGVTFTDDVHASVKISTVGATVRARIVGENGDSTYRLLLNKVSEGVRPASIQIDIDYVRVCDTVRMASNISMLGYMLALDVDSAYSQPAGHGRVGLLLGDIVGTAVINYSTMEDGSTEMSLDTTLDLSAIVDVDYYGILIKLEMESLRLSSSDAVLLNKGYDYRTSGLVAGILMPLTGDFTMRSHDTLKMRSLTIHNDSWETTYKQYSNTVIDIRDLSVDMQRGRSLALVIEYLQIRSDMTGHDSIDRTIEHLSINRSLSDDPVEPERFDPAVVPMATLVALLVALVVGSIAALAVIRHEHPEMFSF